MDSVYQHKDSSAKLKDVDDTTKTVSGYFSAFNNIDSDGDQIIKGAFARSVTETGPDSNQPRIKHLYNHNITQPLGKLTVLKEDDHGLYFESKIGSHTLGLDFIEMVKSGLITESSIGYRVMQSEKSKDGKYTILKDIKLFEGSSLSFLGANPLTPITEMKAATSADYIDALIKQQKQLEKFCHNSTATDETISYLLIANNQLTQKIIDLIKEQAIQQGAKSIEQDTLKEQLIELEFKSIYSLFKLFENGTQRIERPVIPN